MPKIIPKKVRVLVISPGGEAEIREIIFDRSRSIAEMLGSVLGEGTWVKHVPIIAVPDEEMGVRPRRQVRYFSEAQARVEGVRQFDMFVNENGGLLGLPVNLEATRLHRPDWTRGCQHPALLGTAVIFLDQLVRR